MLSRKVILIGKFGVGKTSLVRQFVYNKFSEEYMTTIGVKIDKKIVKINSMEMSLLIWDIAGESSQDKVPASYKLGAHGVLYVFDLTRPTSYERLSEEIRQLQLTLPNVPIRVLANKSDLLDPIDYKKIISGLKVENVIHTSASTGENVNKTFNDLAYSMR